MKIIWSLPVRGERLTSTRGDVVRARHLIEALRADGHEVIVIEDAAHGHTEAAVATYRNCLRSVLPARVALILRDVGRLLHGVVHGMHVAAAARSMGADLLVETQVAYNGSGALAVWLTDVPLVLDDCSPASEERAFETGVVGLARAVLAWQARRARSVVAVSPELARMLAAEGVPRERIVCVPNGVSAGSFTTAPNAQWRERCAPEGACIVGFAGSFQPWHRVELLVDALAELPRACRVHVVLAGRGAGLESVLEAAARRNVRDRVTVLGPVPAEEVPSLLSAWDIGVLPHSNTYGDPMKLREYAAAGLATVAPDLAPVHEVIDQEVTGLLFRPGDGRALAHALARLAADPAFRRRLGDEARRRALASGSWTERARALMVSVSRSGISGERDAAAHRYGHDAPEIRPGT